MSHAIQYLDFHCSTSEKQILKEVNAFAYDPQGSCGYHGDLTFHRDIICKNRDEAKAKIDQLDRGWYSDHAVFYKDGRKKMWLVKIEWHC